MALANLREPETLASALLPWLQERLGADVEIDLPAPELPGDGGSSDTFLLSPRIRTRGVERSKAWILRIQAGEFQIYMDPSVERQFRVMEALGLSSDVPVPRTLWYEANDIILGAPFFLMERVPGELPDSRHHSRGLFTQVEPAARETMWISAIEAMAKIHRVTQAPFQFLARPELGSTGLEQELAFWYDYMRWSGAAVRPVQERALRWLEDNLPAERPTGLAWGDARPGNMIFRDNACCAVIDWETASLAGAETDLGWWLFFDWFVSEGMGNARLEGLGDAATTIALWEQFVGRKAAAMEWHQIFATFRYSLISDRARHLLRIMGRESAVPPEAANPVPGRLAALLER